MIMETIENWLPPYGVKLGDDTLFRSPVGEN